MILATSFMRFGIKYAALVFQRSNFRLITTHTNEQACIKIREKCECKKIYKCILFLIEFFLFFLLHIRPYVRFDWRAA